MVFMRASSRAIEMRNADWYKDQFGDGWRERTGKELYLERKLLEGREPLAPASQPGFMSTMR